MKKGPWYINTGSPKWDTAAFLAWREGLDPGTHGWMQRIRELLPMIECIEIG